MSLLTSHELPPPPLHPHFAPLSHIVPHQSCPPFHRFAITIIRGKSSIVCTVSESRWERNREQFPQKPAPGGALPPRWLPTPLFACGHEDDTRSTWRCTRERESESRVFKRVAGTRGQQGVPTTVDPPYGHTVARVYRESVHMLACRGVVRFLPCTRWPLTRFMGPPPLASENFLNNFRWGNLDFGWYKFLLFRLKCFGDER